MTSETDNTVPGQLAKIGRVLLANGWVQTRVGEYRLPGTHTRLNMQYAHREATLSVSTWDGIWGHLRTVLAYYRGEHPMTFAFASLKTSESFLNIFEVFEDNPSDNG